MKVKFDYVEGKNFFSSYANGVWGGLTPMGFIDCNFYLERNGYPDFEEIEVNDQSMIVERKISPDPQNGVREVLCSLLIDVNFAKSLVQWLTDKIETFETKTVTVPSNDQTTSK